MPLASGRRTEPASEHASAGGGLARGATLGRYVVLDRLGAGGMGVVYAAYDPELDRKVALKLLRDGDGARDPDRAQRLQREAQTMARLSHPNLGNVFDVGTHDGQLFVAMEYIDGTTLRAWLAERPRTWREVLAVFVRAGHGLAAAHSAGVIHRDFKPDNVLIARDGRVVVADFGLARAAAEPGEPAAAPPAGAPASLTLTGAVLGTPAYVAAELWRGGAADERSDLFAFCVSLHEALHGVRPFAPDGGDDLDSADRLALAILGGEVRPVPAGSDVPARVRRVIARGLSPVPEERPPSMAALLAELERDPAAARRRWLAGAVAAGGAAAIAALWWWPSPAAAPACRDGAARLAGVWDDAVRARLEAAWRATGRADAADVLALAAARLDAYAGAWVAAYDGNCAAGVRREQSAELFDLRSACLLERRRALGALTGVLAERPDRALLDRAVEVIGRLPSIEACADAAALRAADPPPSDPAVAAQAAAAADDVARAEALARAARYQDALALAEATSRASEAIAYPTLRARALVVLGELYEALDRADARPVLERGAAAAGAAHDDELLGRALLALVRVLSEARKFDEAGAVASVAGAVVARRPGGDLEGRLLLEEALIEEARQELAPARERAGRALGAFERALGADHERTAAALLLLARLDLQLGRLDDSLAEAERAARIFAARFGPNHPKAATARMMIGANHVERGGYEAALAAMEQAAASYEIALGPDHLDLAKALNNVGSMQNLLGRYDDAQRSLDRALEIKIARLGPDHPDVATSLVHRSNTQLYRGRAAEAIPGLRRALAIRERALGPDSIDVADAARALAKALLDEDQPAEAHALAARAVAIHTRVLGAEHRETLRDLDTEGNALWRAGQAGRARAVLERALATAERMAIADVTIANLRFHLARALWDSGGDRRRAVALATDARAIYARAGSVDPVDTGLIDAWLRDHRR